jgi:adenine-specific DNA-methyltransferase
MLNAKASSRNIIKYSSLNSHNGWNLQNKELLEQIESIGTPFGQRYMTRCGIATLKNDIYIFNPIKEDKKYYYLQNGSVYQIEKAACKDIVNPNKLTKKNCMDNFMEKAIFPYYFEREVAKLLSETQFQEEFPLAFKYLQEKKQILNERDKGQGNYNTWYAYGRNQSLEKLKNKLFFPHITQSIPNYVINTDENLLFYNGLAVISDSEEELQFLKKLMSSSIFWFYIMVHS